MCTRASIVEVRVALVPRGAVATVAGAVGGVDALAISAPASIELGVALGGVAVTDVPAGPVQYDGHGEVIGAILERTLAVLPIEPGVLHKEQVVARRLNGEGWGRIED